MSEADPQPAMTDDADGSSGPPSGGRPVEFPPERFLEALEALGATSAVAAAGGGVTTDEVADEVGCAYRTAHARLHDLADEGRVDARKVGQQYLWRLAGSEE